jgi:hypothetical protein
MEKPTRQSTQEKSTMTTFFLQVFSNVLAQKNQSDDHNFAVTNRIQIIQTTSHVVHGYEEFNMM